MEIINKEEIKIRQKEFKERIADGALFIHPTDTIYGIGCDATLSDAVTKLRDTKQRPNHPFSVIPPSKDWILENCVITNQAREWIDRLPGPYTLILKTKKTTNISSEISPGLDSIGVRIPDHWISEAVALLGCPITTTSANKVGQDFMTQLDDLDDDIKTKIDFIIYEGEKKGRPSKIIDLTQDIAKIIER